MAYLGIDPGLHGAWALLSAGGELVSLSALPLSGGRLDARALAAQWSGLPPVRSVAVELVHAMPGQGVTSMFSFGETTGIILGVLGALGHIPVRPTPQRWQKALGVALPADSLETDKAARRKAVKARAAVAACNLIGLDAGQLTPKGCRTLHDGLVDAVLIAEWLRRQQGDPWDA
jgi:crossover junction endodeoxyribonuclease RuvC